MARFTVEVFLEQGISDAAIITRIKNLDAELPRVVYAPCLFRVSVIDYRVGVGWATGPSAKCDFRGSFFFFRLANSGHDSRRASD